jgi:hypothetical protein
MTEPRVNDGRAKQLRARLRREQRPCHLCGGPIDYQAHHLEPTAFQLDHLWQIANGGPAYDWNNVDAAHRACNRERSNKVDELTIAIAAQYGHDLAPHRPRPRDTSDDGRKISCPPNGQLCTDCQGTHHPSPDVTFVTSRNWWTKPDTTSDIRREPVHGL